MDAATTTAAKCPHARARVPANGGSPPRHEVSLEVLRHSQRASMSMGTSDRHIDHVEDAPIPVPAGPIQIQAEVRPKQPVLVYFHSGRWVMGNLDSHDPRCRALANGATCFASSIGYRLAP